MSHEVSPRNAVSQTSKLALLVNTSKSEIWFWASLMITITVCLSEISFQIAYKR